MDSQEADNSQPNPITPELVRKVADEVYAMLQRDLKIEYERRRLPAKRTLRSQGGR
jgi:hypothetical protein